MKASPRTTWARRLAVGASVALVAAVVLAHRLPLAAWNRTRCRSAIAEGDPVRARAAYGRMVAWRGEDDPALLEELATAELVGAMATPGWPRNFAVLAVEPARVALLDALRRASDEEPDNLDLLKARARAGDAVGHDLLRSLHDAEVAEPRPREVIDRFAAAMALAEVGDDYGMAAIRAVPEMDTSIYAHFGFPEDIELLADRLRTEERPMGRYVAVHAIRSIVRRHPEARDDAIARLREAFDRESHESVRFQSLLVRTALDDPAAVTLLEATLAEPPIEDELELSIDPRRASVVALTQAGSALGTRLLLGEASEANWVDAATLAIAIAIEAGGRGQPGWRMRSPEVDRWARAVLREVLADPAVAEGIGWQALQALAGLVTSEEQATLRVVLVESESEPSRAVAAWALLAVADARRETRGLGLGLGR